MFRTELHIPSSPYQVGLSSRVVTAGSYFSDVVGQKLRQYKVETLVNPFGTIFNPVSLCRLLEMACSESFDAEERLVENQGIWYHYDLHSSFSSPDQEVLVEKIKGAMRRTRDFLSSAHMLVLTFGTAYGYFLKDDGEVVANCHKILEQNFERRLLSYYDMVDAFGAMCAQLKMLNPNLKVVLTVSPVRHLRETITLNSVSKANLIVACHHITENFPDVAYFPSYEVMMDDLRDYRFYKDDMIHPSPLAENYIWEKFTKAYCNADFHAFLPEWDQIRRALAHKPFHPQSKGHQNFLRDILDKLHRLRAKVNVSQEMEEVKKQLIRRDQPEQARRPERPEPDRPEESERPRQAPEREIRPVVAARQPVPAPQQPAEEVEKAITPEVVVPALMQEAPQPAALAKAEPAPEAKVSRSKKSRNRRKKSKEGQLQGESRPQEAPVSIQEDADQNRPAAPASATETPAPVSEETHAAHPESPAAPAPTQVPKENSANRPLKFIADRKKRNKQERPPKPVTANSAPSPTNQESHERAETPAVAPEPTAAPGPSEFANPVTDTLTPAPTENRNYQPEAKRETPKEQTGESPNTVPEEETNPKTRGRKAPAKSRSTKLKPTAEPAAIATKPADAALVSPPAPAAPTPTPKAKKAPGVPRKPRKPAVRKVSRPGGKSAPDTGGPEA